MDMKYLIPGWEEFVNGPEPIDIEVEMDGWNEPDYIPSTYLEDGVRKIYVWDEGIETRYTYTPENGLKQVKEVF